MEQKIAFVKTGWSEEYKGGLVVGRYSYLQENETGHERFNFLQAPDRRYYGYLPPIGTKYRPPQPKEKGDWLVIFVSARNGTGPLTVVGWYDGAVFNYEYQNRPEYQLRSNFEKDEHGQEYTYCVHSEKGHLIPEGERKIIVSGKHFGRIPIVYAQQGGGTDQDAWRKDLVRLAKQVMESQAINNSTIPYLAFPDQKHRNQVEDASMGIAKSYLESKGYSVEDISEHNRGYDLLATKKKSGTDEELHVEVKGTSTSIQRFYISRREKLYMSESRWRLLIVTDALTTDPKISLLTSREVEEKFKFNEFAWEVVLK